MELVDIEKELKNFGCNTFRFDKIGLVSFHQYFGDVYLHGEFQKNEESYLVTVFVEFLVNVSFSKDSYNKEKLLELNVSKQGINEALCRIEDIIDFFKEKFTQEENILDSLQSNVEIVNNNERFSVCKKLFNTFLNLGIVFGCNGGVLNRRGMINLYVTLETTNNDHAVVSISYGGILKYQRYITMINVDKEIKNIEKCVELFKENFIDSETLLEEIRKF
jgi:hypothetical protein